MLIHNYEYEKPRLAIKLACYTTGISSFVRKCEEVLLRRRRQGASLRDPLKLYRQLDKFGNHYYLFRYQKNFYRDCLPISICRLDDCSIITKTITILAHHWKGYSENTHEWLFNLGGGLYGFTHSATIYCGPPNKTICKSIEVRIRSTSTDPQFLNMTSFSSLPGVCVGGRQVYNV